MMGAMEAFDQAIRERVIGCDGVMALVGERVYIDQAPPDAVTPYVVISLQAWTTVVNRTTTAEVDATYNVRGVVDVERQGARLGVQLGDQIAACFEDHTLAIQGWGVHWCRQRSRFRNIDVIDRKGYKIAGSLIQIGAINA